MDSKLTFKEFLLKEDYQFHDFEVANIYMHNKNMSVKEISDKTGKSIPEIYRILKKTGMKPNRMPTNHHNVKMFSDSGLTIGQIADLTGYTPRNVRYILEKM